MVLLCACGGGVSDSITPPIKPDTTPTNPGGTVQRTSLTVHVQIDPADAAIASTAGIGIAGLSVRLTKAGSSETPKLATTDATGTVKFDNLLDGSYTASVERVLTAAEVARLNPDDREASVFAGGSTTPVTPPNAPSSMFSLVATRRGSLVISEIFQYIGYPIPYNYGFYFEVYNNGDTTAYLDGTYVARTSFPVLHTDNRAPCDAPSYQPYRSDSERLWVTDGVRFPGTGQQYPVPPGEARVVAVDALDHRVASGSTNFADLSGAQFESVGTDADTDNPTAVNMQGAFNNTDINAGQGRGLRLSGPGVLALIRAAPMDGFESVTLNPINTQAVGGVPFTPKTLWGIPRADVIDELALDYSADYKAYLATTTFTITYCLPFIAATFDRVPAEVVDGTYRPGAIRRRSLGRTPDGREILMRTRTSARDLEVTTNLLQRSLNK